MLKKTSKLASIGGWIAIAGAGAIFIAALLGFGEPQEAGARLYEYLVAVGLLGAGGVGIVSKGEDE